LRDTRACLICITHWTFEYIDGVPFPDIREVIDMHVTMKGGKKKKRRPGRPELVQPPEPEFDSIQEQAAYGVETAREASAARRDTKHISTQPLWVQQSFAMRNKGLDELFPKKPAK
jgi:hypothetical protein